MNMKLIFKDLMILIRHKLMSCRKRLEILNKEVLKIKISPFKNIIRLIMKKCCLIRNNRLLTILIRKIVKYKPLEILKIRTQSVSRISKLLEK